MSDDKKCARCGARTPVTDNIAETQTYYGFQVKTETETTIQKVVRLIIWQIKGGGHNARVLRADEEQPLCPDCGNLLVGRFIQGRSVPAIDGKETW